MYPPLVYQKEDTKWNMLKEILKSFDKRRGRQELAKHKIRSGKGIPVLKIALTAIFFSVEISYVISELRQRESLRKFMRIDYIPPKSYIYRFLSRFDEENFVNLVLSILNTQCGKRSRKRAQIAVDSTAVKLDLNWFRRKITKKDLEDKEFKWAYSPSNGYYIGYKLTMAVDIDTLKPLGFLIHEGSPNDAKLFDKVMEELKRRRIARNGDVIITDKGYYSYKNYLKGISRYKVVPLIFPKKNFSLSKVLGLISYPLQIFMHRSGNKRFFDKLVKEFINLIGNWRSLKTPRSIIEDMFKLVKNSFSMDNMHRYTERSVKKFVALNVLLLGVAVTIGISEKGALQRLAEERF